MKIKFLDELGEYKMFYIIFCIVSIIWFCVSF